MTSLIKLAKSPRVRAMISGKPKAGKTGSLVSLINSGRYRVGILDFDNNPDPLVAYVKPEFQQNVSIITLEDDMRLDEKRITLSGEPKAFRRSFLAIDNWDDGEGNKWGPVKGWGPDHILVWDSLTSGGEAARNRILYVNNRVKLGMSDRTWGLAMDDENAAMQVLTSDKFHCHVLAMAHLKQLSPKEMRHEGDESKTLEETRELISLFNARNADDSWYPSALGRALPPNILAHFPISILAKVDENGRRVLRVKPDPSFKFDIGVPCANLKDELPIETGLLSVFDAITGVGK